MRQEKRSGRLYVSTCKRRSINKTLNTHTEKTGEPFFFPFTARTMRDRRFYSRVLKGDVAIMVVVGGNQRSWAALQRKIG